jgi:hypothetical protein
MGDVVMVLATEASSDRIPWDQKAMFGMIMSVRCAPGGRPRSCRAQELASSSPAQEPPLQPGRQPGKGPARARALPAPLPTPFPPPCAAG